MRVDPGLEQDGILREVFEIWGVSSGHLSRHPTSATRHGAICGVWWWHGVRRWSEGPARRRYLQVAIVDHQLEDQLYPSEAHICARRNLQQQDCRFICVL